MKKTLKELAIALLVFTTILMSLALVILNGYPKDNIASIVGVVCTLSGIAIAYKEIVADLRK